MTRVKAKMNFDFSKFDEVTELERAKEVNNDKGRIYLNDKFLCEDTTADYLIKENEFTKRTGLPLVEVIEVIPKEEKEAVKETVKGAKKNANRKSKD